MAHTDIISTIAAVALITLAAESASAQDETVSDGRAPPTINEKTIGILRQHQAGSIILPQGTPPFPAVVVLHGCNGVSQNTRVWARRLASWGYAALVIDSFSSRGLTQVCDGSRALPGPERAKDVFAAATYLRSRSDIDAGRIAVLGYSHGGWTALNASTEKNIEQAGVPPFRRSLPYIRFVRSGSHRRSPAISRYSLVMPTTGQRPRTAKPLWTNMPKTRHTAQL